MNNKTLILLQYLDFHGKNVDEAWSLLEWIAWDSFEFDKASRICGYSCHDPCAFYAKSYYAPLWCDMCNSSAIMLVHALIMYAILILIHFYL